MNIINSLKLGESEKYSLQNCSTINLDKKVAFFKALKRVRLLVDNEELTISKKEVLKIYKNSNDKISKLLEVGFKNILLYIKNKQFDLKLINTDLDNGGFLYLNRIALYIKYNL